MTNFFDPAYQASPFVNNGQKQAWLGQLRRLFIARQDDYAIRRIGGSGFFRQNRPLSYVDLEAHINGDYAIGVYPQDPLENCVKTLVLDIDCRESTLSKVRRRKRWSGWLNFRAKSFAGARLPPSRQHGRRRIPHRRARWP